MDLSVLCASILTIIPVPAAENIPQHDAATTTMLHAIEFSQMLY
jgi:hypothetical protein